MAADDKSGFVLVVDRDEATRSLVTETLEREHFEVEVSASADGVLTRLEALEVDVLLAELELLEGGEQPDLGTLRAMESPPEIVLVGSGATAAAVSDAIKRGADHYLSKPLDPEALREIARRAVEKRRLEQENTALRRLVSRQGDADPVVSESGAMKLALEKVARVSPAKASVLITGETGSGKGVIAQTIHRLSPRASAPFMPINCGALQEQLLESELFGHVKGAFTGASSGKLGLFEVANGGTLFLDEIAEMSPAMQTRLLQVLDAGVLRRVGGTKLRRVDTRIVAATNRDLKTEVREDRFREDLFYRLNVVRIEVPPLRSRREDIPGLVEIFLAKFAPREGESKRMARRTLRLLMEYHWPGNVRELANLVESMSLLAPGPVILPEDLPPNLQPAGYFESRAIEVPLPMSEMERLHILRTLDFTEGKKAPAARLLGIDVKTLSNKIKAYNIDS